MQVEMKLEIFRALKMTKTNKTGVYFNLVRNDKVLFYLHRDINDNKKLKWVKVGKYSNGIREINALP